MSSVSPRSNEVEAARVIIDETLTQVILGQKVDMTKAAKQLVKAVWRHLTGRRTWLVGIKIDGVQLLYGPYASTNAAQKAAESLGGLDAEFAVFPVYPALALDPKSLSTTDDPRCECGCKTYMHLRDGTKIAKCLNCESCTRG